MAELDRAKEAWKGASRTFRQKSRVRTVISGDGRGTGSANLYVGPLANKRIYVRDIGSNDYFIVNDLYGNAGPYLNAPLIIEKDDQVLTDEWYVKGLDRLLLPAGVDTSTVSTIGAHAPQHQFRGGDDVFIDGRLFLPGLVSPTTPISASVKINPIIYHGSSGWGQATSTISPEIARAAWIPAAGTSRYVLIAIDSDTGQLVYKTGEPFSIGVTPIDLLETFVGGFDAIPEPTGRETPLAAILLTPTTTTINWDAVSNNIHDTRVYASPSIRDIYDRLDQTEGYIGNNHALPATGAQATTTDDFKANAWALNGKRISETTPIDEQTLTWDSQSETWRPGGEKHFSYVLSNSGAFSTNWNNEVVPLWQAPKNNSAILVELLVTTSGTLTPQLSFNLQKRDWDSMQSAGTDVFAASQTATSAGEQITSFTQATIDPRGHLMFTTGSGVESGSVTHIQITGYYTV